MSKLKFVKKEKIISDQIYNSKKEPNNRRYITKTNVLFDLRNLRRKSIAIREEKKEEIIPKNKGNNSDIVRFSNRPNNSIRPDIVIAGIPIRNENLAADFLFNPENKADVKVTPDLDTPGIKAND